MEQQSYLEQHSMTAQSDQAASSWPMVGCAIASATALMVMPGFSYAGCRFIVAVGGGCKDAVCAIARPEMSARGFRTMYIPLVITNISRTA